MPSRSTNVRRLRSSLTLEGVHPVGGLQAAGFVTHPPRKLRLRRMLGHTHQRIHPIQQLFTLRWVKGLAGPGDRIHMTGRHGATVQGCRDRR